MNLKAILSILIILGAIAVGGTIYLNQESNKEPEMVYRKPAATTSTKPSTKAPTNRPTPVKQVKPTPTDNSYPKPPILDKAKADAQVEQVLHDLEKIQELPPEERAKAMNEYRELLLKQNGIVPSAN